jgi:hypothetical protein
VADLSTPDPSPRKVVVENLPLPSGRKEIVAAIERALNLGGVIRLLLEYNKPLKVWRNVRKDEMPEAPEELVDSDILSAARNAEMEDLAIRQSYGKEIEKLSGLEVLLHAFSTLSRRKLKPRALMIHLPGELRAWLKVDANFDVSELFGVEVITHKQVPDNVALLVATTWDDPDTVVYSLRLEMFTSKEKRS